MGSISNKFCSLDRVCRSCITGKNLNDEKGKSEQTFDNTFIQGIQNSELSMSSQIQNKTYKRIITYQNGDNKKEVENEGSNQNSNAGLQDQLNKFVQRQKNDRTQLEKQADKNSASQDKQNSNSQSQSRTEENGQKIKKKRKKNSETSSSPKQMEQNINLKQIDLNANSSQPQGGNSPKDQKNKKQIIFKEEQLQRNETEKEQSNILLKKQDQKKKGQEMIQNNQQQSNNEKIPSIKVIKQNSSTQNKQNQSNNLIKDQNNNENQLNANQIEIQESQSSTLEVAPLLTKFVENQLQNYNQLKDKQKIKKTEGNYKQKYELEQKLSVNAKSIISLVKDPSSNKQFIMKSVKRISKQLPREFEMLEELNHPNIVKIYEVIKDNKKIHIVCERYSGGDLLERLQETGNNSFSEFEARQIMLQLLSTIQYIHSKGIVHRDINPENIVFEAPLPNKNLRLIDFASAIFQENSSQKLFDIVGTSYFIAPEVFKQKYDYKCDI